MVEVALTRTHALLFLVACAAPQADKPAPGAVAVRSIDDVRREVPDAIVTVGPAVVVSGESLDGVRTYVQDPVSGRGLEVRRGGLLRAWPPPVGTEVELSLLVSGSEDAPVGWLASDRDVRVRGAGRTLVERSGSDPVASFDLVRLAEVELEAATDGLGRAPLSVGRELDPRLLRLELGRGARGALRGVITEEGGLAPRFGEDWEPRAPGEGVLQVTAAAVRAGDVPVGARVRLEAVQATPWSADGRWSVLQDPGSDAGLWVDAEGVLDGEGEEGTLRTWEGLLGAADGEPVLRLEALGPPGGAREVVLGEVLVDGAVVAWTVAGLGPVGGDGRRRAGPGWWLDPRLGPIDTLPDPVRLRAAVREEGDELLLAVIGAEVP